jgi:SUKH-4 immunity protein
MTPEEFKAAWEKVSDEPLTVFPISVFEGTGVSPQTRRFMSVAGLPDVGPSPALWFDPGPGEVLETVSERWDLSPEFEKYRVIGTNIHGDPVVLCPDDSLAYLNHDMRLEEVYINKDVSVFAEAALFYPDLEPEESEKERLMEFLRTSDPRALEEGSFWSYEFAMWNDPD